VSTSRARTVQAVLSSAIADAEREGLATKNAAQLVNLPARPASTREALTVEQVRTLFLSVAGKPDRVTATAIALLTGLRQGERLGLATDAIDLDRDVLGVTWELQRVKWEHGCQQGGRVTCGRKRGADCPGRHPSIPAGMEARQAYGGLWLLRPKSKTGWREVPICDSLHAILQDWLAHRQPGDLDLIFTTPQGHPIDPRVDSQAWADDLTAAGLPALDLHCARHTTNTLLFELGVPVEVRQAILGHASAAVNQIYTHVSTPQTKDAMRQLGTFVAPSTADHPASVADLGSVGRGTGWEG
jgi:integrase